MKLEHEDELILSYLNSFAQTIALWIESNQRGRIISTTDKFACIMTAYMNGKIIALRKEEKTYDKKSRKD